MVGCSAVPTNVGVDDQYGVPDRIAQGIFKMVEKQQTQVHVLNR